MSRIGKLPIAIPAGVQISVSATNLVTVKGKLGQLQQQVDPKITLKIEADTLTIERHSEERDDRAKHGLYRSLIFNMVKGVSEGFKVEQELVGVGYKVEAKGQVLEMSLGYSHNIIMELPPEVKVTSLTERSKNPLITQGMLPWNAPG